MIRHYSTALKTTLFYILMILFGISAVNAQKNDTVILLNGDRISGELKKFEYGLLSLKTDGMSTLSIEYDHIKTFYSTKNFEIIDVDGFTYFGSFAYSATPGNVLIVVGNGNVDISINEVVQITRIKNIFWHRFSGSVDFGASYYKSTNIFQYNLNTSIDYRAKRQLVSFSLSSIVSDQLDSEEPIITKNNDIGFGYERFITGKWWAGGGVKLQQNTELNLDYRFQLGIIGGYDIIHTNPVRFYTYAGLLANKEKSIDTTAISSNLEGLLSMRLIWIVYRHPRVNISTNFDYYPSITIRNRHRMEYNLNAKYEIFKDFYLGATFYEKFDSKSAGDDSALSDWGTTFSIGYSF
jgi:hypothetical protein